MKNMKIDAFKDFNYISDITASKDFLAYHLTKVNMEDNGYDKNIYLYDLKSKKNIQLTNSNRDYNFKFFSDGSIVFLSSRLEGKNKKVSGKTKELEALLDTSEGQKENKPEKDDETSEKNVDPNFCKDNDGDKIQSRLFKINPNGGESQEFLRSTRQIQWFEELADNEIIYTCQTSPEKSEYQDIDVLPFWFNGAGYTYGNKTDLYRQKLGQAPKKLNTDDYDIRSIQLNKEKSKALIIFNYRTDLLELTDCLGLLDLTDGSMKKISEGKSFYFADFIGDGLIAIASEMKVNGINEDAKVFYMNLDGSGERQVSPEGQDISFFNSIGTDVRQGDGNQVKVVGEKLYFISTYFNRAILSSLDLNGNIENIIDREGSIEGFDIYKGEIFFTAMRDLKLPELYKLEKNEEIKLTDFSKSLEDIDLSRVESFDFTNDGIDFTGYVLKPLAYEKGKKYPGILEVHGGPKTAFSKVLHHEMQWLAGQGYFVFYTNPRGSSGRGDKFSDIRGKYGSIDYDDLMVFTDEVLARYEDLDQNRLGVMGGSYGGFMTNWIIGHTDRFKAANSQRSISNWTSFYGVSDIGFYFAQDQTGANPWDNLDDMWKQSPLKYARNIKTPTLFIHSDSDYRCPLEQGIQMYAALKVNKVDSKLVIFNGENHELSRSGRPFARLKRLNEIGKWFEKYLG